MMFEKTIEITVVDTTAKEVYPEAEVFETTVSDLGDISDKLDTIIENEQSIYNALWLIIGIASSVIVIKLLWTVVAKWFFGGV